MEYLSSEGTETQRSHAVFLICDVNFAKEREAAIPLAASHLVTPRSFLFAHWILLFQSKLSK